MRIYQVARKLKVKSADVSKKLALLNIKVAASSKIDPLTAKKAEILVKEPLRVEEVAAELDLSVEKLLKKLKAMKIEVISHLSLLHEPELIRLLKLKSLDKLKVKPSVAKLKAPSKAKLEVLKIKPKKKRVFELAEELGVSENALLKKLRQMNVLALHRRSPLDPEMVESLKKERYRLIDKISYSFVHSINEIPELIQSTKRIFTNTTFYIIIITILILAIFVSANVLTARNNYWRQKLFAVKGEPLTYLPETYQVLETVALLEVEKTGAKFPIVEEGKDDSPITAVLIHKNTTVIPGAEGTSVLEDSQGVASETLKDLKKGDVLIVTDIENNIYYYRVIPEQPSKGALQTSFKSIINLNLEKGRKIVAVLQKVE